jgi:hypothetical protein
MEEARGILDSNLLDDVGTTIYCRCRDILIVSDAAEGRVSCPGCGHTVMRKSDDPEVLLECGSCGWSARWGDYRKGYRHQELYARGLAEAIGEFMRGWERAMAAREKMFLIDRMIHVWHWQASRDHQTGRPAAVNLIEGNRRQVLALLEELSGGRASSG